MAPLRRRAWRWAALSLFGLAINWRLPGRAEVAAVKEGASTAATGSSGSGSSGAGSAGTCGEALTAGQNRFDDALRTWTETSRAGRALPGFGSVADSAEQASLAAFDSAAGSQGACDAQRKALQDRIRKDVLQIVALQRSIAERQASADLNRKLLNKMSQRGGPLRVQEKLNILEETFNAYKASVKKLQPAWADMVDPQEAATERRLGDLEFGVEDSREGLALQKKWEDRRMRDLMSKRAYGMSVSFDPALRVLVRPEGLGNLQVFSQGPLGPPSHPANVNFGVINDASMPDVYREHPVPPFLAVQPAVNVNLNLGSGS
ncbi:unnamed protein product [Symbiodinium natans]|uniref:Uncharacterized protein n=1 Tax=Symbiodinium natans TaxID=878477 RepID=A0A812TSB1_9DINO|nr:unnamed protein product [Symbiodinium natans]